MSLYASPSLFLWACFFRLVTDLSEIAGPPEQSLTVPAYSLLVSLSGECRMFPPARLALTSRHDPVVLVPISVPSPACAPPPTKFGVAGDRESQGE